MTRQVLDQLYIEIDYFTPEEYYVYIAEAQSSQSAAFTQTTAVGKLVSATADLSSEFTQTAQGYRTVEIVLSAFSDAALSSTADVTRNYSADLVAESAIDVTASGFENAEAALTSTATMAIVISKVTSAAIDISAEFTQIAVGDRIIAVQVALESSVTMDTVATRSVSFGSGLSSNADCACVNYRVRAFDSAAGALFNTAVQATATINSFAVLDSVSNLTADVTRQVGASSAALDAAFTINVNALSFTNAAANLTSEFTISVDALSFSNGQAALTSTFTQTAVPEYTLLYRDPVRIAYSGTYARISTTEKKFGTYSLKADDVGQTDFAVSKNLSGQSLDIYDFDANDWTIEFFYRDNEDTSSGEVFERIFALKNSSGTTKLDLYKRTNVTTSSNIIQLESNDWTNTGPLNGTYAINVWRHLAVTYTASTKGLSFYIDGSRIGTKTFSTGWTNMSRFSLGGPTYAVGNAYIDELRISDQVRYTGTSFTVPTTQFAKNRKDVALFRFEQEYLSGSLYYSDSETILQDAEAALSSEFAQSTAAVRTRTAQSSLSSSFAVTAVIGSIEEIATAMFDDVELSVTADVIKQTAIAASSEFTQTTSVDRLRYGVSDLNSEFTQVTDVSRTRYGLGDLVGEFTQTTDNDILREPTLETMSASFELVAAVGEIESSDVFLEVQSTITVDISVIKESSSAMSSTAELAVELAKTQNFEISLSSEFAQSIDGIRLRRSVSEQAAEFTQTAVVAKTTVTASSLNSEFTQTVTAVKAYGGYASLLNAVTVSATVDKIGGQDADLNSEFAVTAAIGVIKQGNINGDAVATQLTAAARNATGTILMESQFGLTSQPGFLIELERTLPLDWDEVDDWDNWQYEYWDPNFPQPEYIRAKFAQTASFNGLSLAQAQLSAVSTLHADIGFALGTLAALTAEFGLLADADVEFDTAAAVNSTVTVTAQGTKLMALSSTMSTTAELSLDSELNKSITADLDSAFAVTAQARLAQIQFIDADLSSEFTVDTVSNIIEPKRVEAQLAVNVNLNCLPVKAFGSEIQLDSAFAVDATVIKLINDSAALSSAAQVSVTVTSLLGITANLPAVATQLTVASNIHIDEFYQYKVEAESRQGTVLPENRVFQVESETRVNMII